MSAYIIRRLLLIIPTLLAIITINFFLIQLAPGGPVDQAIAKEMGLNASMLDRVTSNSGAATEARKKEQGDEGNSGYRASVGLTKEDIEKIKKQFGFDRPMHERYFTMLWDYIRMEFGDSLFRGRTVMELILDRLPVSISLGLWTTLLVYMISIPLGIRKAVKHSGRFDVWSTTIVLAANAVPSFLFAVLLIIFFAGGNYWDFFPLRGLVSNDFDELSNWGKIADYANHMFLPVVAMTIGGFASLTMLTKNSFLDEIHKQYVITAKAKGLTQSRILYRHVFRNAMLIIIAGFPAAFIGIFFTGSLLIEVIFSLDGLGLLAFEATLARDYPVIFATLYIFGLMGLLMSLLSDLMYSIVDPRINFESN
ncbi:MAG: microcin C ABC transporter permease YejB [Pseudomonadales bacterium]|nr:microcin C ABC transporter permease YejB [Pseudomonadales bacterium]NRA17085.1 microcin C ABC transporter permease YejB [Oceanospirillaceae bacterium]